jgi:adenylate cyclase
LGGERIVCTVLFSDIRGFTTFSEQREPGVVVEILNRYLDEITEAVMDHGGTLVSYMGDGIMAVFGAPIPQKDHADRALASALEMIDLRLPRFNSWLAGREPELQFEIGIGLNSGPTMSGQVGSRRRVDYTVIGDTTNTAARLEGMTKGTPHSIYLASSTRAMLQDPPPGIEFVENLEVRGRSEAIGVWTMTIGDS